MRKIKQSIRYFKMLLVEIIETLCTICLYLESEGRHTHNQYGQYMRGHFNELKAFSTEMRLSLYDTDREVK